MSFFDINYFFGDYSNQSTPNKSYVSGSKIESGVERGEEDVASVVVVVTGFNCRI